MNSETQTTSVPSHCEAQLVAANPQPSTGSSRRRTGKIATLPKSSRTRLNQMLEDGLPYAIIIKSLGRDGKRLTENNLSDWHKGGYQDWLKEQEWLDDMRA